MERKQEGLLFGWAAYLSWGLLPLYWSMLSNVPAIEVLAHRVVWSFIFLWLLLALIGGLKVLLRSIGSARLFMSVAASSLLIAVNWGIYIWSVQNGFVLEASLGYFICPLVSIVVGMLIFKERLTLQKSIAIGLAAFAVLYLAISYGHFPWIALLLAVTFALYGAMRKGSRLESVEGLLVESGVLCVPALAFIVVCETSGRGAFLPADNYQPLLLAAAGVVTALPLIWFAAAARRLPLSTIGMLQYIAPSCQFLLAVFWFQEPIDQNKLMAFGVIWTALLIYSVKFGGRTRDSKMLIPAE